MWWTPFDDSWFQCVLCRYFVSLCPGVGQSLTWLCHPESLGISVRYLVRIELVDQIMKHSNEHNEETLGQTYKCYQNA